MWFNIILSFFLFLSAASNLQHIEVVPDEKVKILVVPFDRFGFQSDLKLSFISHQNKIYQENKVYDLYKRNLVNVISEPLENYSFFPIAEYEESQFHQKVPIIYKEKPTGHYGANLEVIMGTGFFDRLLKNFSADYMLILSRYEIKSSLYFSNRSFEGSKYISWSKHYLDYELYDQEGNLIALADNFKMLPNRPTDSTFQSQGILLDDLAKAHQQVQENVIDKLKKFKGKPIYKVKK